MTLTDRKILAVELLLLARSPARFPPERITELATQAAAALGVTNLNDIYAAGLDCTSVESLTAHVGRCTCTADDCDEVGCPLCARLDPEFPCPIADADPEHAAILACVDHGVGYEGAHGIGCAHGE